MAADTHSYKTPDLTGFALELGLAVLSCFQHGCRWDRSGVVDWLTPTV